MRGTHVLACNAHEVGGIIPAHAGNTELCVTRPAKAGDHPRACGEHRLIRGPLHKIRGSSPRMRGTRSERFVIALVIGIIPAHAGNTRNAIPSPAAVRDHPRACGEHWRFPWLGYGMLGSSPRMRGTHFEISTIPRFLDSFCLFFIQFHFEYFFACRYLLALLHPRRRAPPKDTSFALDGRLTSSNPSQSVGDQSAPCTLNARCCSFLAE